MAHPSNRRAVRGGHLRPGPFRPCRCPSSAFARGRRLGNVSAQRPSGRPNVRATGVPDTFGRVAARKGPVTPRSVQVGDGYPSCDGPRTDGARSRGQEDLERDVVDASSTGPPTGGLLDHRAAARGVGEIAPTTASRDYPTEIPHRHGGCSCDSRRAWHSLEPPHDT